MNKFHEILEKTLGIRVAELTSDPGVARLLWTAFRVKDSGDCAQALRRAIQQVRAIKKELLIEPPPSAEHCLIWVDTAATRLTSEMKLSSRAWIELDAVILEAAEAITALAYEAREYRKAGTKPPPDTSRVKQMLAPRLETCVMRLDVALKRTQVLCEDARQNLVGLLKGRG